MDIGSPKTTPQRARVALRSPSHMSGGDVAAHVVGRPNSSTETVSPRHQQVTVRAFHATERPGGVARRGVSQPVELPGIEPGSYGIPSRLLRAQSTMSLLGSPGHAD